MKRLVLTIVIIILSLEILLVMPLLFGTPVGNRVLVALNPTPTPTPQPVLTARGAPPAIKSAAAYLIDADTGNTLANINGQKALPMASTTKVMTALLAVEKGKLDALVTVGQDAVDEITKHADASSAQLVPGDKISLHDLLYGLMLPSGNDAAVTIADAVGGSVTNFVRMMNVRASQLHLTATHYTNTNGLTPLTTAGKPDPASANVTSAADLAHLTLFAMKNPIFSQIVQTQRYVLPAAAGHHGYIWENTNLLLELYPGTTGVKTGHTDEAGYCLVFSASDGRHHLLGVILHDSDQDANQRFTDARTLLNWGFHLPQLPPKTVAITQPGLRSWSE